jgi:hypothetical protein
MEAVWFKTERWNTKIQPVEVVKVTEKTVTVRHKIFIMGKDDKVIERRHDKTGYEHFFPTWEEAHSHLLTRTEGAVHSARRQLELAQSEFGNVKGMKQPGDQ